MDQKNIEEIVYSMDADDLQSFAINKAMDLEIIVTERDSLKKTNQEFLNLLKRNLERMKLINGPEQKCIVQNKDEGCANHGLIVETAQALAQAEGK